ncbi:hypothetical protein [Streptomyces sp. NPDC021622]|uniref:hypothetical protein n=1 Tax=Streptomyces sp. NPDC021622 TaxID=3155013 RepID=UPI003405FF2B
MSITPLGSEAPERYHAIHREILQEALADVSPSRSGVTADVLATIAPHLHKVLVTATSD